MAKYRAKVDIPPNVKAGDIVTVDGELIPEFKAVLEPVVEETAVKETDDTDSDKTLARFVSLINNPDRNALKEEATKLGLTFASNIPTDRLIELINEAKEKDEQSEEPEASDEDQDEAVDPLEEE